LLSALLLYFLPKSQAPGVAHEGDTVAHHRSGVFLFALLIASFGFVGCSGLVAGNNGNPPLITLAITNVLTGPATTSSCQVDWTTTIPADSAVDYGTSTVYGSSTPVDAAMVTSHQVVLSGLAPSTVYYYQVRSTDSKSNNAHSSSHSFKTSGSGPSITMQPTSQTVTAGQTASFSVAATGTAPLNYQWNRNGAGISGATSSSYSTPATTSSDNGAQFTVVVSNTAGTVTSSAATLSVTAAAVPPSVTTQPANLTVTAGQVATFNVVAAGTAPLSYQWRKNGTTITAATSSSYSTPATTSSDNGAQFTVVVTNTAGSVTSGAATLTVNPAPTPGIQVSPASVNFGNAVVGGTLSQVLIITNTGTSTLSISQVAQSGPAFSVSGFSSPNISPGQQTTITVAFQPTSVGASSGNISIVSNAPTSPTSVALSGTGIAATLNLTISPTSLSFGSITTGTSSAPQTVTITNTGNSNVTISQISLIGAGYSITSGGAPVTLSPSQSLALTVWFSPTATGSTSGSISIVSNANGSPASVSLSGTGIAPVQHSATLVLNASPSTVSGYNVYRSTASGTGYTKLNSSLVSGLTYTDSSVQNGTTYFYVATAVDSGGTESSYSNEMQAVIP
jgi:hypothetical protein